MKTISSSWLRVYTWPIGNLVRHIKICSHISGMHSHDVRPTETETSQPPADLREYLAAERTTLAYVRTGLSMMGIGFVVARFGLVLRIMKISIAGSSEYSTGTSLWIGTGLVLLGALTSLLSTWQYWQQVRQLNFRMKENVRVSWIAVSLAFVLAIIGVAMAAYLVTSSSVPQP
jgi:putative membrane protein